MPVSGSMVGSRVFDRCAGLLTDHPVSSSGSTPQTPSNRPTHRCCHGKFLISRRTRTRIRTSHEGPLITRIVSGSLGNLTDHAWALPLRRWAATAVLGQNGDRQTSFADRNLRPRPVLWRLRGLNNTEGVFVWVQNIPPGCKNSVPLLVNADTRLR